MKTRVLGTSGLRVSAIGLGAMPLSLKEDRPGEEEAIGVIHHAIDCGVMLIDTADSYCMDDREVGHNERLIGKALGRLSMEVRGRVVVATKGGCVRPGGRWEVDGRPGHLREVCEQSLVNLGVERIDLYQYHTPDPRVPIVESVGELRRLQEEGKIAHVGVSNFSVEQLEEAMGVVEVVSVQNQYSPRCREPERDGVLEMSEREGVAFLPWSPLNGMGGAKSVGKGQAAVERVAKERGVSRQRVVLAWLLAKGPMVIPIPGASRKKSIEDSAKAAELELTEAEVTELDRAWG